MIHYTCDLCGKQLGKERFEAKIEVAPAYDPDEICEDDLNNDHLQQIADEIAEMESTGDFELPETGSKVMQLDFCSSCAARFIKSPLNASPPSRVGFSSN